MAQFTTKGEVLCYVSPSSILTKCTDGSSLVSVLWPRGLPQFVKGNYVLGEVHQLGQLVPNHEDGLREWCYVATEHSPRTGGHEKFLAYTKTSSAMPEEIAVRFQGFVRDVHLDTFGTWSGYVAENIITMQLSLSLEV